MDLECSEFNWPLVCAWLSPPGVDWFRLSAKTGFQPVAKVSGLVIGEKKHKTQLRWD